jgi:hypothetical protein
MKLNISYIKKEIKKLKILPLSNWGKKNQSSNKIEPINVHLNISSIRINLF